MFFALRLGPGEADHDITQLPAGQAGLESPAPEAPELLGFLQGKRKHIRGSIFASPFSVYFLDRTIRGEQDRKISSF